MASRIGDKLRAKHLELLSPMLEMLSEKFNRPRQCSLRINDDQQTDTIVNLRVEESSLLIKTETDTFTEQHERVDIYEIDNGVIIKGVKRENEKVPLELVIIFTD